MLTFKRDILKHLCIVKNYNKCEQQQIISTTYSRNISLKQYQEAACQGLSKVINLPKIIIVIELLVLKYKDVAQHAQ